MTTMNIMKKSLIAALAAFSLVVSLAPVASANESNVGHGRTISSHAAGHVTAPAAKGDGQETHG